MVYNNNNNSSSSDTPVLQESRKKECSDHIVDICQKLASKQVEGKVKVLCLEALVSLAKELGASLSSVCDTNVLAKSLRPLFVHRSRYIRAATLRTIRHLCRDVAFSISLWQHHCHFFVSKALDRDKRYEKEREQALKLAQFLIYDNDNAEHLPLLIVHSLVSIADTADDPYRRICILLLRDLVIKNPRLVSNANGVRTLLNAVLEPNMQDIAESLVMAFLYVLDDESTRKYLRPAVDLQVLLSPFTEVYIKDSEALLARWDASRNAISIMTRTWAGLMFLTSDGNGLKPLVELLRLPGPIERKRAIFDTFITIMRGCAPVKFHSLIPLLSSEEEYDEEFTGQKDSSDRSSPTFSPFLQPRANRSSFYKKSTSTAADNSVAQSPSSQNSKQSITNSKTSFNVFFQPVAIAQGDNILKTFLAVVLLSFVQCGLIEALIVLSREREVEIAIRSSELLHVILIFCDALLSRNRCLRLHDQFDAGISREISSNHEIRTRTNSMLTTLYQQSFKIQRHVPIKMEELKSQVDISMDVVQVNALIKESMVLVTKDTTKWEWDKIKTLLYGPLRVPQRLTEALKTKFCKRLISFYKPKKKIFCELPYKEEHIKYSQLGCQLIDVLVSNEEGCNFMKASGFLTQIADMLKAELKEIDSNADRILKPEKVAYTMAREYFTLIGKFSSYASGVQMLRDFQILNIIYELTNSRVRRDDLCQLIIKHMDYRHSNDDVSRHTRMILYKAMTSGSKRIRYFATLRLRHLFRAGFASDFAWGIELLKGQLCDEWSEIVKSATRLLEEACLQDERNLDALIRTKPLVNSLENEFGKNLLLRFLSRPIGFTYLSKECEGWIDKEMAKWRNGLNEEYVKTVELALNQAVTSQFERRTLSIAIVSEEGVCIPPHFYGELCKTKEGCEVLRKSGHFNEFLAALESNFKGLQKRAALWAIGHVGSSDTGFQFIKENNLLVKLVNMAETSPSLSLRGVCLLVVGLMAKSSLARAALKDLGWETQVDPINSVSIAVPIDATRLFKLPEYEYEGSTATALDDYTVAEEDLPPVYDERFNKILENISLLANPVMQDAATKTLKKMRLANMDDFCAPELVFHVYRMLTKYKYKLQPRRFIHDLFDGTIFSEEDFTYLDTYFRPKAVANTTSSNSDNSAQSVQQ